MGKKFKSKLRKVAISISDIFEIALIGNVSPKIEIILPKPVKIPSMKESFEQDMKNIAGDFNKVVGSYHVQKQK